ncbi:protein of unknown function [Acidithiobacillus ferrivorans]|uniref:Uncharacterized protein n=1 Tax=Acidithiobacillus ferrivorans TaxID=160808 RepID=A0A060UQ79_9PROT|nr:hypothetical protein [Acidithiobacillus ferrivorans]MBU2765821.1 hypothetical protein [Acidithiobacillus ferrivorans]CDQ10575.1 hypothetical protein AFERRI_400356 [Acidithiobacillus ferrivorans]SMH64606.1 protein of unknown function [Acidithiobacillus ferrivorans]
MVSDRVLSDEEIIDIVIGYVLGFEKVLTETGMEGDDLAELLLNNNVEKCENCDWFTESCQSPRPEGRGL